MGDDGFNSPFAGMKKELLRQVKKARRESQAVPAESSWPSKGYQSSAGLDDTQAPRRTQTAQPGSGRDERDEKTRSQDAILLRQYMAGVKPIDRSNYVPSSGKRQRGRSSEHAAGAESAAALYDFVHGAGNFDIEYLDEYVTGLGPGVDSHLLVRLKRGDFAVQAHIDLHGLYADEARDALIAFFERARRDGKRCVLVVHGRGLHSPEGTSTLKELLLNMLTYGPLSKHVLAFATARPVDGGPGAMYVLLRRNRSPFR